MSTRILLIEDESSICDQVTTFLTLKGYEVTTASTGREGIGQALSHSPHLILCDILMPEMDGYQVLQAIRSHRPLGTVPFIFLTAKAEATEVRQGMSLGADDYLTKPFKLSSLLRAIESRIQREAQREAHFQERLEELRHTISSLKSHEYNTPLSGILGFITLLQEHYRDFEEEDNLSMLSMMKTCALRLKRSLDNRRLFEELNQELVGCSLTLVDPADAARIDTAFVEQCICQVNERQDRPVSCQLNLESGLLKAPETSLRIILDELIDNAHKFSDGTCPIEIIGSQDGAYYHLKIINQGMWFRPEDIARIAPFAQFNRKTYEQQGAGLGLALVKRLLELNQATLAIDSWATGQTTVVVSFPLSSVTTRNNP